MAGGERDARQVLITGSNGTQRGGGRVASWSRRSSATAAGVVGASEPRRSRQFGGNRSTSGIIPGRSQSVLFFRARRRRGGRGHLGGPSGYVDIRVGSSGADSHPQQRGIRVRSRVRPERPMVVLRQRA